MKFQPVARVYLADNPANPLATHVANEIRSLEMEAKRIRENGGQPRKELAERVNRLIDETAFSAIEHEEYYEQELHARREAYEKEVNRRPMDRIAKFENAKADVAMMTDEEALQWATDYSMNPRVIDDTMAKLMAGRLNTIDPATGVNFKEIANEHHVFEPWLRDPDTMRLAQDLETVKFTKPGNVAFKADDALMQTDIRSLIDFDGELDA